ncbi:MAG: hypothetical protein A2X89_11895 [Deltaproteobacteria bacterium GWD2_55_8]|nr:MAG: hypothetical protein A2X89_11895 [Deltaproteobacteria bacterium GWD2_55_8]
MRAPFIVQVVRFQPAGLVMERPQYRLGLIFVGMIGSRCPDGWRIGAPEIALTWGEYVKLLLSLHRQADYKGKTSGMSSAAHDIELVVYE